MKKEYKNPTLNVVLCDEKSVVSTSSQVVCDPKGLMDKENVFDWFKV